MSELISIIMPTYNLEQYVAEAVKSIQSQTYKNFEFIIIDDGSRDSTFEILSSLSKGDNRIRLFRNERNLKIVKSLNKGLKLSRGKYIVRMDGDDISLPNRLDVMKRYLDTHEDIDIVGSQLITINEKGKQIGKKRYPLNDKYIKKTMKYLPSVPHFWMARRQAYEELNGYRELPYAEDYDLLLRGIRHGFKYANVNSYLYKIRLRNGNTSSSNGLKQQKVRLLVQRLYKKEKINGKDIFNNYMYNKAVQCSERELLKYNKAAYNFNLAISNKENKLYCLKKALRGMFESKYMMDYGISAMMSRLGILEEKMRLGKE